MDPKIVAIGKYIDKYPYIFEAVTYTSTLGKFIQATVMNHNIIGFAFQYHVVYVTSGYACCECGKELDQDYMIEVIEENRVKVLDITCENCLKDNYVSAIKELLEEWKGVLYST